MTNTIRHILGVPIGFVVTPLAWYGMTMAAQPLFSGVTRIAKPTVSGTVLPLLVMLVIAAVLGLMTSAPFISPVAALITGGVNLLFGLAYPLAMLQVMSALAWLPGGIALLSSTPAGSGTFLSIGVILLVSAAFPHRWRASVPAARPRPGVPPAGPPPYPYGTAGPGPQGPAGGRDDVPGPPGTAQPGSYQPPAGPPGTGQPPADDDPWGRPPSEPGR